MNLYHVSDTVYVALETYRRVPSALRKQIAHTVATAVVEWLYREERGA